MTGATFSSAVNALTKGFDKLQDGVTVAATSNVGAQAAAANYNWMQVQLVGAFSDISHIRIWGGLTGTSSAGFLTVWLSSGTNFTATGTKCVEGVGIIPGVDAVVTCPTVAGSRFVTIERRDALTADLLVIHELRVFRPSEQA